MDTSIWIIINSNLNHMLIEADYDHNRPLIKDRICFIKKLIHEYQQQIISDRISDEELKRIRDSVYE